MQRETILYLVNCYQLVIVDSFICKRRILSLFSDFITFPTLTQTNNFGDLGGSIVALLHLYDPLYFLDTIILIVLVATKFANPKPIRVAKHKVSLVFVAGILLFSVNLGLAESDRPELLTRTFDRNYIVKYLGAYNYTIYDGIQSAKASTERALADGII